MQPKEQALIPRPKADKPYRILHISDIHFGANFDTSAWEYLKALARREAPDLIACTGDLVDHGSLFVLAAAKIELELLCAAAGEHVTLRCVPGNHDCGPFGIVNLTFLANNFLAVFGPEAMQLPKCMPSYIRYRRHHSLIQLALRGYFTIWLYARKLRVATVRWWSKTSLYAFPITRNDDPKEVVLIHLDSNHTSFLASGSVNPASISKLKAELLNLRDEEGARSFAPRIALMHHHALPIPEASIKEGLTSFEPFLVLRNAGFVLRELNRCDVDLILALCRFEWNLTSAHMPRSEIVAG